MTDYSLEKRSFTLETFIPGLQPMLSCVETFRQAYDVLPNQPWAERLKLIEEESKETIDALCKLVDYSRNTKANGLQIGARVLEHRKLIIELVDGVCDWLYVLAGSFSTLKLDSHIPNAGFTYLALLGAEVMKAFNKDSALLTENLPVLLTGTKANLLTVVNLLKTYGIPEIAITTTPEIATTTTPETAAKTAPEKNQASLVAGTIFVSHFGHLLGHLYGFDLLTAFIRVHNANMLKFWSKSDVVDSEELTFTPVYIARNKNGKVIKPPEFDKVDLNPIFYL